MPPDPTCASSVNGVLSATVIRIPPEPVRRSQPATGFRAVLASFLVLFAAEWGDLSQLLTITLVARAEKRFGKDVREMLSVIANQVAISLENGFLYRKMETMATTDGLTGLSVPEPRRAVMAPGESELAIPAECHGPDAVSV